MIVGSIDVVIQAARLRDGSRRITHITEVLGLEGEVVITQDLFVYEITGEDAAGRVEGRHRSTGNRPSPLLGPRPLLRPGARTGRSAGRRRMNNLVPILVGLLGFVAVAGLGFAFVGGDSNQAKTAKRVQAVAGSKEKGRARIAPAEAAGLRRKQILETLKSNEKQQRKTRLTIESQIRQAGLSISVRNFWIVCGVLSISTAGLLLYLGLNPLLSLSAAAVAGLGLPRWALALLIGRRNKKFTEEFPNAIDIIVRGIKSGLPVHDCLGVIARETPQPVCTEFQRLVEGQAMGVSLDQSLEKMYERMPTAEVRFFAIVMNIQQKTGGNLAEALSNLSAVLRSRKLMREKIKAMAGEAVASASIIGSLPPGLMGLVSLTSPGYMAPMYIDARGHLMLLGGAMWMGMGIFVMRRMINLKI